MREMGRRERDGGSHLGEGTASVAWLNARCRAALRWWGRSEKQQGGGFARGVLRSEDGGWGGGEGNRGAVASGGSLLSGGGARQGRGGVGVGEIG
jgi:hypothetical protein